MKEIWIRLREVLAEVIPEAVRTLALPAKPEALSRLRLKLGVATPKDLVKSLLVHDGQRASRTRMGKSQPTPMLFNGHRLLATGEIYKVWKLRSDTATDLVAMGTYTQDTIGKWWSSALIPVTDLESDGYCLDTKAAGRFYLATEVVN